MDLPPGTSWGAYVVEGLLARGATAAVYRARHASGAWVALKVLDPGTLARDAAAWSRFQREAELVASLRDPGVVRLLEAGAAPLPYLVLELVAEARHLDVAWGGRPLVERVALVREVACILGRVHARGVVHRDVKPPNVLVDLEGRVRVTDFGYAHAVGVARLTRTGEALGTLAYMAPEVLVHGARRSVDPRVDVWALGVLLHEAITGERPFPAGVVAALEARSGAAPPCRGAPAALAAVCRRALALAPEERLRDGACLAAELEAWLAGSDATAEHATPPHPRASSSRGPSSLPPPGARLGDYQLLEVLGRGGMGCVYRARHVALGRQVAIKVLLGGGSSTGQQLERFRREGEAAARVRHPHLVSVHAAGEEAGLSYLVLDLVAGPTLERVLAAGPLPVADAARLVRQLAGAVGALHAHGILHRDLKPANVLLDGEGRARLTDFGVAKVVDLERLTASRQLVGTPLYMAPELLRGEPADVRGDVYGLGALLYEALCGAPPVTADAFLALMAAKQHPPSLPSRARPEVPAGLDAICLGCLAPDPDDRYASADALAADLDRLLAGARRGLGPPSRGRRRRGRRRAVTLAGLTLLVGSGALLGARHLERPGAAARASTALARLEGEWAGRLAVAPDLAALPSDELAARLTDIEEQAGPRDPRLAGRLAALWGWCGLAAAARDQPEAAAAALARARERTPAELEPVRALRVLLERPEGGDLEVVARTAAQLRSPALARLWAAERLAAGVGDAADAGAVLDALEALGAAGAEGGSPALELEARCALVRGDLARAEGVLERLAAPPPDLVRGVALLAARALIAADRLPAAAARLAEAPAPPGAPVDPAAAALADEVLARLAPLLERLTDPDRRDQQHEVFLRDSHGRLVTARWRRGDASSEGALVEGLECWANLVPGRPLPADVQRRAAYAWRHDLRLGGRSMGDVEAALAGWHAALGRDDAAACRCRARVRQALGDDRAAIEDHSRALALDPDDVATWNDRGLAREAVGELDGALSDYRRAAALEPAEVVPWINQARVLLARGDVAAALEAAERAVLLDPSSPSALVERALVHLQARRPEAALTDCSRAIALDPERTRAWMLRGNARVGLGDIAGARADYDRAIELDPANPVAWLNRAGVQEDPERAVAEFTRVLELAPSAVPALRGRAAARERAGDPAGARADWERTAELAPDDPEVWSEIGRWLQLGGAFDAALEAYGRAIDLAPSAATPRARRAVLFLVAGRARRAAEEAARAVDLDPECAEAWDARGRARELLGDRAGAAADYSRAIELEPGAIAPWTNRAFVRVQLGDREGALADAERAVELGPRVFETWYTRAGVRRRTGDLRGALADLDRALELAPGRVDVLPLRAEVHEDLGDGAAARSDLRRFLELAPRHPLAARVRRQLERLR